MKIRITQDQQAHATYIYVQQNVLAGRTEELPDGMRLDFDNDGNLVGIEALELVEALHLDDITDRSGGTP